MPYITKEERTPFDRPISTILKTLSENKFHSGAVTYVIYRIVHRIFLNDQRYETIARIRGILLGVLDEFNRRLAHPYEDLKIKENGDIE